MRHYAWDLPALFACVVAVALQMMWLALIAQAAGNQLTSGVLLVLFLT